jgi:hypothetical protein
LGVVQQLVDQGSCFEISKLTPRSAQIAWGPSQDPEGDQVTYSVSLRKRIEGVAQAWLPAHETRGTSLSWDGLSPNTLYEIRIRASDGKSFSDWRVKENAFRTPVRKSNVTARARVLQNFVAGATKFCSVVDGTGFSPASLRASNPEVVQAFSARASQRIPATVGPVGCRRLGRGNDGWLFNHDARPVSRAAGKAIRLGGDDGG